MRVSMTRHAVMLEELRVTARAHSRVARSGFAERRGTYRGARFITASEITRRGIWYMPDLFRHTFGVYHQHGEYGMDVVKMRGLFGSRCDPNVFLDGMQLRHLSAEDLNTLVSPRDLAGVEVYPAGQAPPELSDPMSDCGTLVFWTR